MNREETKRAAEVMLHYANRGEVQWKNVVGDTNGWLTCDFPAWNWDKCLYRIKPQPVEVRQWAVVNTDENTVACVFHSKPAAEQYMMMRAHRKFQEIVELKGTYTCDT